MTATPLSPIPIVALADGSPTSQTIAICAVILGAIDLARLIISRNRPTYCRKPIAPDEIPIRKLPRIRYRVTRRKPPSQTPPGTGSVAAAAKLDRPTPDEPAQ
jgi:hypothetical protein